MSIYDKASLVLIPSGTKTSKVYSQKPTNGDGDFTFSRSTAATRVNASGNIEKETQNLLNYSNNFGASYWLNNAGTCTRTGGQSGYDGTSDAWLITQGGATGFDNILSNSTLVSGVYTFSVYAKANTGNTKFTLRATNTTSRSEFNLTTGTIVASAGIIDDEIVDVGGGWYRCSATFNASSDRFQIYPQWNSSSPESVYIQDAQLEQGLVARDYIETTTTAIYGGITDNVPRLDYTDSSCPALLLEPQRTNLLNHGEYFGAWTLNAGGTGSAPILEANTTDTLSPEGKYNAYKVTFDSGAGTTTSDESIMYRSKSGLTAGSNHTASVYLKGETGGEEVIVRDTEGSYKKWTLTTEWARYEYTQIASASSYATSFGIRQGVVGIINSDAVVYMYGFQSELGSYATSYIPTYGSAVTRNQEEAYNNQSLVEDVNSFTMYVETEWLGGVDTQALSVHNNSTSVVWIQFDGLKRIKAEVFYNSLFIGQTQTANDYAVAGNTYKIAYKVESGNCVLYVNGSKVSTSTDVIANTNTLNYVELGSFWTSQNNNPNHRIKNAMVFNQALTDQEAIDITTI